jgi:hypothetical protein
LKEEKNRRADREMRLENDVAQIKAALQKILGAKFDTQVSSAVGEGGGSHIAAAPSPNAGEYQQLHAKAVAGYDAMRDKAIAAGQPVVDTRPPPPKYWTVKVGKRDPAGGVRELRIVPGPSE